MPKKLSHHGTPILSSGSGLPSSSMAVSSLHLAERPITYKKNEEVERVVKVLGAEELEQLERQGRGEWEGEMEAVARSLAIDFPLLDLPLILSLISDLNPNPTSFHPFSSSGSTNINTGLQEIRETLAILEASLVPDLDDQLNNGTGGLEGKDWSVSASGEGSGSGFGSRVEDQDDGSNTQTQLEEEGPQVQKKSKKRKAKGKQGLSSASRSSSIVGSSSTSSISNSEKLSQSMTNLQLNSTNQTPLLTRTTSRSDPTGTTTSQPVPMRRTTSEGGGSGLAKFGDDRVDDFSRDGGEDGDGMEMLVGGESEAEIFLIEMFPTLPHSTIKQALERFSAAGEGSDDFDLSPVIEDLLSDEAIRAVKERGEWEEGDVHSPPLSQGEGTGTTDDESGFVPVVSPVLKKRLPRGANFGATLTEGVAKPVPFNTPRYGKISAEAGSGAGLGLGLGIGSTGMSRSSSNPGQSGSKLLPAGPLAVVKNETTGSRYAGLKQDWIAAVSSGEESGSEHGSPKLSNAKVNKAKKRTIPVVDMLQRRESAPAPRTSSPAPGGSGSGLATTSQPTDNSWHTITSLATYLSDAIPSSKATPNHFLSYFHSKSYNSGYSAMKGALEALMVPKVSVSSQMSLAEEVMGMGSSEEDEVWQREARRDLGMCVRACDGDVSAAMDLMELLQEVRGWQKEDNELWNQDNTGGSPRSTSRPATLPPLAISRAPSDIHQFPASPQAVTFKIKKKDEHPQNWKTVQKPKAKSKKVDHPLADFIPSYSRGVTPHDPTPGSLFASGPLPHTTSSGDAAHLNEYRRRAAEERRKREEAVREAGRYYKINTKSNGIGKGKEVAAFYASEARRYEQSARMWELKAAREVVKNQSSSHGQFSIDIHHLSVAEAGTVVREAVHAWHSAQHFVPAPAKPFQVITGVGKHSINHVGILLPAVSNLLESDGWKVDRGYNGRGYLLVRGVRGS